MGMGLWMRGRQTHVIPLPTLQAFLPSSWVRSCRTNLPIHAPWRPVRRCNFFQDPYPLPDNKVYWYRVSAEDPAGNRSPLSPPARAALWDRKQPELAGEIRIYDCDFLVMFLENQDCYEKYKPDPKASLTIIDETQLAKKFALYERCGRDQIYTYHLVYSGNLSGERRSLFNETELANYIARYGCYGVCGMFIVRFFGWDGRLIRESEPFKANLCEPSGCVVLDKECHYEKVDQWKPDTSMEHDPVRPIRVCPELKEGECARVYQQIGGKMSPVESICFGSGGGPVLRSICGGLSPWMPAWD